jgi:hypothetical protein
MIVEVRTYRVKPGQRERFLELFERETVPLQQSLGMRIVGPLVDLENPDVFIWLRAFPSLEERERMTEALYGGERWLGGLRETALSMLEGHSSALTETTPAFVDDLEGATAPNPTPRPRAT